MYDEKGVSNQGVEHVDQTFNLRKIGEKEWESVCRFCGLG